jgi:hypothetical protein
MSTLLDQINKTTGLQPTAPKPSSSLLSQILAKPINEKIIQYQREQVAYDQASKKANSFGGIAKGTLGGILGIGKNFVNDTWNIYQQTPQKIVDDIKTAASEITNPSSRFNPIKTVGKVAFRTAGDTAIAIFAPISAAIGAVLGANGGQKLIDKTGEIIADHTGITDIKAFQDFAMSHPNAGEDFNRLLTLVLGKGEKGKIEPTRILNEVETVAKKLIGKSSPIETLKENNAPTLGRTVGQDYTKTPVEAPITPKTAPETTIVPKTLVEQIERKVPPAETFNGNAPSGLGKSIETKAIEAELTKGFQDVAGYDASTIKEQAQLSSDLINSGIENARAVVKGNQPLPPRLRGSALIVAMEDYLTKHPNAEIAHELANSPLTSAVSQAGSELGLMQNRVEDSITAKFQEIKKARESRVEKYSGKSVSKTKNDIIKEIKSKTPKIQKQTWSEFVEQIKCNY